MTTRKDTFYTIEYKGLFIHVHHEDGVEVVEVDGKRFKSVVGAKRVITIALQKQVKQM
jgi:hypothetical protein